MGEEGGGVGGVKQNKIKKKKAKNSCTCQKGGRRAECCTSDCDFRYRVSKVIQHPCFSSSVLRKAFYVDACRISPRGNFSSPGDRRRCDISPLRSMPVFIILTWQLQLSGFRSGNLPLLSIFKQAGFPQAPAVPRSSRRVGGTTVRSSRSTVLCESSKVADSCRSPRMLLQLQN